MKTKLLIAVVAVAFSALLTGADIATNKAPVVMLSAVITTQMVTNVVEGNNQTGCSTCEMMRASSEKGVMLTLYHPMHFGAFPWKAADEKWTITNIVERTTVTIYWSKTLTHVEDVPVSSTTNRWKLTSEWKQD